MKRFWKEVEVTSVKGGSGIALDGRPVRTPARVPLVVPCAALAEAIADEWRSAGENVDPRAMPMTGLANAAIDRVEPDPAEFASGLARYAEADLACYRAQGPRALIERQEARWDGLLAWGRRRFDVDFVTTDRLMHVDQPPATIERLSNAVSALDAFHLAGLSPLVTIGGSLLAALAVLDCALTAEEGWQAVSIDEQWQLDQWGADAEAQAALDARRRDFIAAAKFLNLLKG